MRPMDLQVATANLTYLMYPFNEPFQFMLTSDYSIRKPWLEAYPLLKFVSKVNPR